MGGLALAAIFFGVMNMKISSTAAMGIGANIREALFHKVQAFFVQEHRQIQHRPRSSRV